MLLRCTTLLSVLATATAQVYPDLRFMSWNQLAVSVRQIAEQLGYDQVSWNRPGTNPIEQTPYNRLSQLQASLIATLLPVDTEASWNCYMVHYEGLAWNALPQKVQAAYQVFGWSQLSWDNNDASLGNSTAKWDSLSMAVQSAAKDLCYFQELWDGVPLPDWTTVVTEAPTPTPETRASTMLPTSQPTVSLTPAPFFRFTMAPTDLPRDFFPSAGVSTVGPTIDEQQQTLSTSEPTTSGTTTQPPSTMRPSVSVGAGWTAPTTVGTATNALEPTVTPTIRVGSWFPTSHPTRLDWVLPKQEDGPAASAKSNNLLTDENRLYLYLITALSALVLCGAILGVCIVCRLRRSRGSTRKETMDFFDDLGRLDLPSTNDDGDNSSGSSMAISSMSSLPQGDGSSVSALSSTSSATTSKIDNDDNRVVLPMDLLGDPEDDVFTVTSDLDRFYLAQHGKDATVVPWGRHSRSDPS